MDLQTAKDYVDDLLLERNALYAEIRGLQAVIESIKAENRKYLLERGDVDGTEPTEPTA